MKAAEVALNTDRWMYSATENVPTNTRIHIYVIPSDDPSHEGVDISFLFR